MSPLRSSRRHLLANPLEDQRKPWKPLGSPAAGPLYGTVAEEATIPDIVPPALVLDGGEPRAPVEQLFDTSEPAFGGWPELYLAHGVVAGERRVLLLHRARAELGPERLRTDGLSVESLLGRRIRDSHVLPVIDMKVHDGELVLLMDDVPGETLAVLRQERLLPLPISVAVVCDVLGALHAGHRATSSEGRMLHLAHGGLSPREILVGVDGKSRLLDFGLADDVGRTFGSGFGSETHGYVAPEQVFDRQLDARTDVFLAAVVLWECLTGRALLAGASPVERLLKFMTIGADPPSRYNDAITPELDAALLRGLEPSPERRFSSAAEFAAELERAVRRASMVEVSRFVQSMARAALSTRASRNKELREKPYDSGPRSTFVPRPRAELESGAVWPARGSRASEPTVPGPPPVPAANDVATGERLKATVRPRTPTPAGNEARRVGAAVLAEQARRERRASERARRRSLRRVRRVLVLSLVFVAAAVLTFLLLRSLSEGRLKMLFQGAAAAEYGAPSGGVSKVSSPEQARVPNAKPGGEANVPVVRAEELPLSAESARAVKQRPKTPSPAR